MTCEEYRAAALSGSVTERHADHLATCRSCRARRESLAKAAGLLDDSLLWDDPAAAVEERVVAAVVGSEPPAVRLPRRPRAKWPVAVISAAAAVVLAVGATAAVVLLSADRGPDWEVAISGTAQTPGAGGTVLGWVSGGGTRVALDVTGIGPAPEGYVYELWFSSEDVHVSGGTFTTPKDVELWVGVARRDYPRIWVTLEAVDADAAPSRRVVLDTRG